MAKYSIRRSRRRAKRKGRGGSVFGSLNEAGQKTVSAVKGLGSSVTSAAGNFTTKITGSVSNVASSATQKAEDVGHSVASSTGIASGGSGKCCFPAKFCGSRKRKGNKRRSIRSGRCCLPVKSKKCGARKKNGRKTRKNKRKRGVFNMFGG